MAALADWATSRDSLLGVGRLRHAYRQRSRRPTLRSSSAPRVLHPSCPFSSFVGAAPRSRVGWFGRSKIPRHKYADCPPKTWERRSVPFPAALAPELARSWWVRAATDSVFTDQRGGVLRNSNYRARVFEPAVRAVQAAAAAQRARGGGDCRRGQYTGVPDDHAARFAAHCGKFGGQCWRQREGGAAHVGAREGQHDAGCVRRPV